MVKSEAFTNEDNTSYYLLGVMLADGCICSRKGRQDSWIQTLTTADQQWANDIAKVLGIDHVIKSKARASYAVSWSDRDSARWLLAHNCIPRKSKIVQLPSVPDKYLADFIRGLFDGDGSITHGVYRCDYKSAKNYTCLTVKASIASASNIFIEQLKERLSKSATAIPKLITPSIVKKNYKQAQLEDRIIKGGTIWELTFQGTNAGLFVGWLYSNCKTIRLERKYTKSKTAIKLLLSRSSSKWDSRQQATNYLEQYKL